MSIFIDQVEDPESQNLTVQLYDYDRFKGDDFIGIAELSLSQFEPKVEQDVWVDLVVDLKEEHQKLSGKVHLRIIYQPISLADEELSSAENLKEDGEDASQEPISLADEELSTAENIKDDGEDIIQEHSTSSVLARESD